MSGTDAGDAEEEARRLRQTLDSIDETFVFVGRDWRVRDMNVATQRLDGRPASQIISRNIFEVWPGLAGGEAERAYRRAMATGEPGFLHHRYVDVGHEFWFDTRMFPSRDGLALFTRDATARVRMEQRLRDAEADTAVAVQAARLGTWIYDPATGDLHWNARHRELFGVGPDAPLSYSLFLSLIEPEDRDAVAAAVAAAIDPLGSGNVSVEYRVRHAGGPAALWLAASGRAHFEDGRCARLTGVVQDVTERRRIQTALEESEARFRAIAEATPMIVFVTAPDGGNTYTNPQFSEYSGLAPSRLLGDGWTTVLHPDDRDQAVAVWQGAVAAGAAYENEFRLRRHDGAFRWFLSRGIPLRDAPTPLAPEGPIKQWLGACTDIQELVEARQVLARDRAELERLVDARTAALHDSLRRLNDSEALLRAVFENSSDILFVLRLDQQRGPVFVDLNAKALAALRRSRAEVIGLSLREVLPDPGVAEEVEQHCRKALAVAGAPYHYSARRSYGGGELRDVDVTALAFEGPGGELLLLLTVHDVTEKHALEEQLRQSQKMEAVGQLTGGIAHDFNNLLTGISGSLELIQSRIAQGRTENLERYAAAALDSLRRAASLTHRLLAFARRQSLDPRPVDLNRLVRGLEEIVRRTAGPAIAVEARLAETLWPTLCDANQLENAILNLCINARDAMPDGGRLVIETANAELDDAYCASHQDARPGHYVCVVVADTGIGMPPDVVSRAFEPFFTTKPLGQGTGLGLSMLYGFVIQSDGHVQISSKPGRGTTVRVFLPRHRDAAAVGEEAREHAEVVPAARGKTVLVVEDEPVVRALVMEVLQELGHVAVEAADGQQALRAVQTMPRIDLLLTDVGLPGMNGRQLADAAREHLPALKILFMTGYAHNLAAGNGMMQPGMELIGKPFTLDALAGKLRALLAC